MRAKPTAQHRSEEKHRRILAAMDALLEQAPFDDITIAEIAAGADVSPATIYQRFRNKDAAGAILLELYFQRVQEWTARPNGNGALRTGRCLRDDLLAIGRDAWDQVDVIGYVMRPAYLYSRRYPDRAGDDWKWLEAAAREGFKVFLQYHANEISVADLDRAAETIGFTVNMLVTGLLLHGDGAASPLLKDRDVFATELAELAFRYLTPATEGHA